MKEIKLSKGMVALVDDGDFEWLNQWKWTHATGGYAYRAYRISGIRIVVYMHRIILGIFNNKEVEGEHIDGNGLNNKRSNLRVASRKQNNQNLGLRSDNKSGFKGISWDKSRAKWFASSSENGKTIALGRFNSIDEAKESLDSYRLKKHGEFANDGFGCLILKGDDVSSA